MEIVDFLSKYWQYISIAIVVFIDILILVIKKDKTTVIDNGVYHKLVGWIKQAEEYYGPECGFKKLQYVIAMYMTEHPDATRTEVKFVESFVDDLLTLPTKKGGPGREEIE